MSEVAEDGEDDGAGQQAGGRVRETDDQRILAGVVPELVVGRVGGQRAEPHTQREEGLCHRRIPHLYHNVSRLGHN